eukprot:SAG11_NODE_21656_length_421_cov_0.642857_1_plen_71_part_10
MHDREDSLTWPGWTQQHSESVWLLRVLSVQPPMEVNSAPCLYTARNCASWLQRWSRYQLRIQTARCSNRVA